MLLSGYGPTSETKIDLVPPLLQLRIGVESHVITKNRKDIKRYGGSGRRGSILWKATSRPFLTNSTRTQCLLDCLVLALQQRARDLCDSLPLRDPLWVMFKFIFPESVFYTADGQVSKRIPDLSNLLEGPQDAMQSAGLIENDRLICSVDGSRRVPGDEYALEIHIFRYQGEEMIPRACEACSSVPFVDHTRTRYCKGKARPRGKRKA